MQEVQLDKHIRLLDSPGVVMATSTSDTSIILKNCVRVSYFSFSNELCQLFSLLLHHKKTLKQSNCMITSFTKLGNSVIP